MNEGLYIFILQEIPLVLSGSAKSVALNSQPGGLRHWWPGEW